MEKKKAFFEVLLYVGASFSISYMLVGETFRFFTCQMCMDNDVLVE